MNAGRDAAITGRWAWSLPVLLLAFAACGDELLNPDPECSDAEPLSLGATQVADLRPGVDAVLDGSLIDYYSIQTPGAGTLSIEMAAESASSNVDPFLYLWSAELGDPIAQAYDPAAGGTLRTARLVHGISPGCYRVGASGWPSAAEGGYTIRADLTP
ncbi:MAG TPA: hypothetical protein VMM83_06875 [Longimicrobiales bacterium]|nr:hypothetical protein [Longimicrobiales bacterium]